MAGAVQAVAGTFDPLVAGSRDYVIAASRLSTAHLWSGRMDQVLANAGAARGYDVRWNADDPRWQKAHAALMDRVTQTFEAVAGRGKADAILSEHYGRYVPPGAVDDLARRLAEPVGKAFLRHQCATHFIVSAMPPGPNAPRPGDPAWLKQVGELRQEFDARFPIPRPGVEPTFEEQIAFGKLPAAAGLGRGFSASARALDTAVNNAVNLALFDQRDVVDRILRDALDR